MRKFALIIASTFFVIQSFSQSFWTGNNVHGFQKLNLGQLLGGGMPFQVDPNTTIKGSPFFNDLFSESYLLLRDDKIYQGLKVRFNLETNKLHFYDSVHNNELVAADGAIKRFYLVSSGKQVDTISHTFGNGYPETFGTNNYTFYEEFNSGRAVFLRLITKSIVERKTLATVEPIKEYSERSTFYIYDSRSKKIEKWRKGKEFILEFLYDKSTEIKSYLATNKISCKEPREIVEIIDYYNSLNK